jgi:hypothetical protein
MTGLTKTPQPSGRQKPLAEWIAELGEGPVSWGRAADELIAGRYRSWWYNHVTGEWNSIVQQYWLSPDPSDHRMAGLSLHERAWLRMNDATWEGRYAVYVEATTTASGKSESAALDASRCRDDKALRAVAGPGSDHPASRRHGPPGDLSLLQP